MFAMGALKAVRPVKLICGIIADAPQRLDRAVATLESAISPIDITSDTWPFVWTDYYTAEMGPSLWRRFVAFSGLAEPQRLIELKHRTNRLEAELAVEYGRATDRRPVNLDPGYVGEPKLVLASTKDHSHRLYLGDGIYGEVTLRYHQQGWQSWPWTYPDYAGPTYHPFLTAVRDRLRAELAQSAAPPHV